MKKIHNIHANQEIYNLLSNKFHILCCFNEHGTMIIYDKIMLLSQNTTITNFGTKFITSFFLCKKYIRNNIYIHNL